MGRMAGLAFRNAVRGGADALAEHPHPVLLLRANDLVFRAVAKAAASRQRSGQHSSEAAMTMTNTVPQVPSISALAANSKCLACVHKQHRTSA
jgi:hypothetical protein